VGKRRLKKYSPLQGQIVDFCEHSDENTDPVNVEKCL